jgi:hypothetical protein
MPQVIGINALTPALCLLFQFYFIVGLHCCFRRRQRLSGTACLAVGFLMVLFGRLVIIGLLLEGYGALSLFGGFLPLALNYVRDVPILNKIFEVPGVATFADTVVGKMRPKYSV